MGTKPGELGGNSTAGIVPSSANQVAAGNSGTSGIEGGIINAAWNGDYHEAAKTGMADYLKSNGFVVRT